MATPLSTLVTLLMKLIPILLKWKCIHGKIMPFWPPCCESKESLSKKFRPSNRAEVFIWENFHPGCRDNRDLPPSHIYEHIDIFTKEIGVRRDLSTHSVVLSVVQKHI